MDVIMEEKSRMCHFLGLFDSQSNSLLEGYIGQMSELEQHYERMLDVYGGSKAHRIILRVGNHSDLEKHVRYVNEKYLSRPETGQDCTNAREGLLQENVLEEITKTESPAPAAQSRSKMGIMDKLFYMLIGKECYER